MFLLYSWTRTFCVCKSGKSSRRTEGETVLEGFMWTLKRSNIHTLTLLPDKTHTGVIWQYLWSKSHFQTMCVFTSVQPRLQNLKGTRTINNAQVVFVWCYLFILVARTTNNGKSNMSKIIAIINYPTTHKQQCHMQIVTWKTNNLASQLFCSLNITRPQNIFSHYENKHQSYLFVDQARFHK